MQLIPIINQHTFFATAILWINFTNDPFILKIELEIAYQPIFIWIFRIGGCTFNQIFVKIYNLIESALSLLQFVTKVVTAGFFLFFKTTQF